MWTKETKQETQSLTYSTVDGLLWMVSGTGLQAILQGLVLVVLARLLTPTDFGLVGAALVVVGFSALFSQLGVGPSIVQRAKLEPSHLRTAFIISLTFGMLLAGIISVVAPVVSSLFRIEELTLILRVMSLIFLFQGLSVVAQSLLQRSMKFRLLVGVQVVSYTLGYGVVGVYLAFMEFGVWALVIAHLTQAALRSTLLLVLQPHPKSLQFDRRAFNELIYFGSGYTAARLGTYVALQGDNLVVGRWLGAEALGLYGRAYQLMLLPAMLLGQALDRVLFPAMARIQNEPEQIAKAYRRGVALIALLVLPTSAAMLVLAPEIIQLLLGPAWKEVIVPFQILTIGMLFRTSYKISDSLAHATGAVYPRAWRQAVYAVFVLAGAWIGKHWGISGVAFGVLTAITMNFILMTQLSLRLTSITWRVFLAAHLPALSLATIIFMEVWGVAHVMRHLALPAILPLITSIISIVLTVLLLLRLSPKLVLGQDGIWMLETLLGLLPQKLQHFDWTRIVKTRLGLDKIHL